MGDRFMAVLFMRRPVQRK